MGDICAIFILGSVRYSKIRAPLNKKTLGVHIFPTKLICVFTAQLKVDIANLLNMDRQESVKNHKI